MTESSRGLKVEGSLDLRHLPPPEAYQKAVDRLRALAEDDILELYLDDGEALRKLPFGLRAEGHEILISEPANEGVRFLVRKRSLLP